MGASMTSTRAGANYTAAPQLGRPSASTNFMTVVGDTRVLPEELHVTAQRLRPIFERLKA
jgi:hypothetical protein